MNARIAAVMAGVVGGVLCTLLERVRPARPLAYRDVVLFDGAAFLVYIAIIVPLAQRLQLPVDLRPLTPDLIYGLPVAARVVVYYLLADLASYWLHRAMH